MEVFTLDRNFKRKYVIDDFHSVIWTERYLGNSDIQMALPITQELLTKIEKGTFVSVNNSDEVMIIETRNFEEGVMKVSGISLTQWLNNRFVRASITAEDRYWYLSGMSPGETISHIVSQMCIAGSPYLNGTIKTGIAAPETLVVPGLIVGEVDTSGPDIIVGVPYGPVYDAIKEIAATYELGMKIYLYSVDDDGYVLKFKTYRGVDRTSDQSVNSVVRFSKNMDSLTNIKELESIAIFKTLVYVFAPQNPEGMAVLPGFGELDGTYEGFDLRALMVFADDIASDQVEGDSGNLMRILNSRAKDSLTANHQVLTIDGEVINQSQMKYGTHYFLGDLVEVEGLTKRVQKARVTEYIRAQDSTGYKAYPTLSSLEVDSTGPSFPVNDDVTTAIEISCPGGNLYGTNLYASRKTGESISPAPSPTDPPTTPAVNTLEFQIICIDDATALTVEDGIGPLFFVTEALDGLRLLEAHAAVSYPSTSGLPTFQIRNLTTTSNLLSTKITIDVGEYTSYSADAPSEVNPANSLVTKGDRLRFDCDDSGTDTQGLSIILIFGSE